MMPRFVQPKQRSFLVLDHATVAGCWLGLECRFFLGHRLTRAKGPDCLGADGTVRWVREGLHGEPKPESAIRRLRPNGNMQLVKPGANVELSSDGLYWFGKRESATKCWYEKRSVLRSGVVEWQSLCSLDVWSLCRIDPEGRLQWRWYDQQRELRAKGPTG